MAVKMFTCIFHMSFMAGIVILCVAAIRLLLKRLPGVLSYGLWSVVLFRLLCPFSFERPFHLLPVQIPLLSAVSAESGIGFSLINRSADYLSWTQFGSDAELSSASGSPHGSFWISLAAWLWIAGMLLCLFYNLIALIRLQKKLVGAVRIYDNVYLADGVDTPFLMGIIHPKIYLPSDIEAEDQRFVEIHEKMHIKHGHHIMKLIAFAALTLHWFNPLVWAAFILFGRDMEMMCDECVLRSFDEDVRRQYSEAVLRLAAGNRMRTVLSVAFGKGSTKARIQNIVSYRKNALRTIVLAVMILGITGLGLLCDWVGAADKYITFPAYEAEKTLYNARVYDIAPFHMYVELPDDWEVRMPSEEVNGSLFFTPVCFYKDDVLMAICGYNTFEAFDETQIAPGDYAQAVYSSIRLGSLYRWDDYKPVVTSSLMETALTNVYINQMDDQSAAAASFVIAPGILSYNKQRRVYIAVQFVPDAVTDEQRKKIAESIHIL